MKKNNVTSLLLKIAALPVGYVIASAGAWFLYPEAIMEPNLIFQAWKHFGIVNIPSLLLFSSMAGITVATVMLSLVNQDKQKYGKAKWGTWKQAKKLGLNGKSGLWFGFLGKKPLILDTSLSGVVCAPPGTGKTTALAIPTLLTSTNSIIATDLKGELFEITAPTRSKFSRIIYFNPTHSRSSRFNPFSENVLPKHILDISGQVLNTAHIIIKTPHKGEDYFTKAARDAFAFFANWLIWRNGETSIPEVRSKILSTPDIAENIEQMIEEVKERDPEDIKDSPQGLEKNSLYSKYRETIIQKLIEDGRSVLIAAKGQEQWTGVMGTLTTDLMPFSDPRIAAATSGKSDIEPEQLKRVCTTVYLVIPDKDMKRLSPVITLIFETVCSQLISEMPKPNQVPVTFLLDEFVRLGRLEQVKELPAISRGYKVNALFICQDFSQIEAKYDKDAESFNSNNAFKIIFRQNDLKTAKNISETVGNHTVLRESVNKSSKKILSKETGTSESLEGIALVTAQDILNLPKDESIIIGQGEIKHPLKVKNNFWFLNKKLKKLVSKNSHRLKVLLPDAEE